MKLFKKKGNGTVSLQEAIVLAMPLNTKGERFHVRDVVHTLNQNGHQVTIGQVSRALSRMRNLQLFIKDRGPESSYVHIINFNDLDEADALIAAKRGTKSRAQGIQEDPLPCPRCEQLEQALANISINLKIYFNRVTDIINLTREVLPETPVLTEPEIPVLTEPGKPNQKPLTFPNA